MTRLSKELERFCADGTFDEKTRFVLQALLDNMRSADSQCRSRMLSMAAAILSFELLRYSAIEKLSLFGVELSKLDLAYQFLPALIAYFYSSIMALFSAHFLYQEAFDQAIECIYPDLFRADIELQLRPVSDFRAVFVLLRETSGWKEKALKIPLFLFVILIFFAPPIYVISSYESLFTRFGWGSESTWMSAALAAALIVYGGLVLVVEVMRPAQDDEADEPEAQNASLE